MSWQRLLLNGAWSSGITSFEDEDNFWTKCTLKAMVKAGLTDSMTPSGQPAYSSGELGKLIEGDLREKFRNPPAHNPISV